MLLTIEFRGQLALAAESATLTREVAPETPVADFIQSLAKSQGDRFRELVLDSEGDCGSTLFIAIDGEHILVDRRVMIPEGAREMIVMPPIAGG